MSNVIILSMFLIKISAISSSYLAAELNYVKPQLERNNIINKGVWIKNRKKESERKTTGDFIFSANSLDTDVVFQNDFDAFRENYLQEEPIVSNYVERTKRSSEDVKEKRLRDILKVCNGDRSCILKKLDNNKTLFIKSKLISKLRPASVFNDYPYEVAILLSDYSPKDNHVRIPKDSNRLYETVIPLKEKEDDLIYTSDKTDATDGNIIKYNDSDSGNRSPKRRTKSDYESQIIKKIEFTEEIDKIVGNSSTNKVDRNVFDKQERIWYQNTPDSDTKINNEAKTNKPITERGLIKVLSMLTKTFKKITKQHSDIRQIHTKLHRLNDDVTKNIADMTRKFQDIEQKYAYIINVSDKIKEFEVKISAKEDYLKTKDKEISKNLLEFQNQQKKFLTQQHQFYNVQKLMLAQNEKVNIKQNLIAKTQSEISHRQNNFARILKKAKQIYIDSKQTVQSKPLTTTLPPQSTATEDTKKITHTTTQSPYTTESVKINLFSIPALNKLVSQDSLILKEKDKKPVDDLVYKYYFNNTFIDNLMKSNVLTSFISTPHNTEITRNTKNKRDEDILETTILLPVTKLEVASKMREKRWVRRTQSKTKLKHKSRGKKNVGILDRNDEKSSKDKNIDEVIPRTSDDKTILVAAKNKSDPFITMANHFCKEIKQNINSQILSWCVEKALRRLQNIDLNIPARTVLKPPTTILNPVIKNSINVDKKTDTQAASSTVLFPTPSPMSQTAVSQNNERRPETTTNVYFPDNDELELKLKQFELKPDLEGNVYYDGSVHTSDIVLESGGFSDIMTGLDSNSRVEMDPLILNMQALRRDPIRRLAEIKRIAHAHW